MTDEKHRQGESFPNIGADYGRTEQAWAELIEQSGITDEARLTAWLEEEHGVGKDHAAALAGYFLAHEPGPTDGTK